MQSIMAATHSKLKFTIEYIKASSYVGTRSGELKVENLDNSNVTNKHVLVIEDIYDTGKCMKQMLEYLRKLHPKSLRTAILIHKCNPENLVYQYQADFTG